MKKLNPNNIARLMLPRLFERASELKLSKKDLTVLTAAENILTLGRKYTLAIREGENPSAKDLIRDIKREITLLVNALEDFTHFMFPRNHLMG